MKKPTILKKLDPFHSMEVLFPEYLEYFHTTKNISTRQKYENWISQPFFYNIYNILQYFTIFYNILQ